MESSDRARVGVYLFSPRAVNRSWTPVERGRRGLMIGIDQSGGMAYFPGPIPEGLGPTAFLLEDTRPPASRMHPAVGTLEECHHSRRGAKSSRTVRSSPVDGFPQFRPFGSTQKGN